MRVDNWRRGTRGSRWRRVGTKEVALENKEVKMKKDRNWEKARVGNKGSGDENHNCKDGF